MSSQQRTLELAGCTPAPLAHYLKALGVLRIVGASEPSAAGWWRHDRFFLRSRYDRASLCNFFLGSYQPTPLVAPWNGGSGFFPNGNRRAINAICEGSAERFRPYRALIEQCHVVLRRLDLAQKPTGRAKLRLLQICRNEFPDEMLSWLDTAYVLTADGPKYPPILGTGGNDGRLEFTNNFMQRLTEVFDTETGTAFPGMRESLEASLFGVASRSRSRAPIGQFDPGGAGGANMNAGYDAPSDVNQWDFILMLEGALAFASASVKKLQTVAMGALSCPFCVRPNGVGYSGAHLSDEATARAEMWMPLWEDPVPFSTLSSSFSEGRVETGRRQARNGVDFARAIACMGIDRGITAFQRFGFHQRNGLSHFAVPLGRFDVRFSPAVEDLLVPLDGWLDRFRRAATSRTAPARAGRALRNLETAILELCRRGDAQDIRTVLIALGEAEAAVAISKMLRDGELGNAVPPIPFLSQAWITKAMGRSPNREFRLACALASVTHERVGPMRRHFEPIDAGLWTSRHPVAPEWAKDTGHPNVVWRNGELTRNLGAVLCRRLVEVRRSNDQRVAAPTLMPFRGRVVANLGDIHTFIEGGVAENEIDALLRGLILIDWSESDSLSGNEGDIPPNSIDVLYSLLKLCHLDEPLDEIQVKLSPEVTHNAVFGRAAEATRYAIRQLRAAGMNPAFDSVRVTSQRTRRIAAALTFPISDSSKRSLKHLVMCSAELPS